MGKQTERKASLSWKPFCAFMVMCPKEGLLLGITLLADSKRVIKIGFLKDSLLVCVNSLSYRLFDDTSALNEIRILLKGKIEDIAVF